ncbi:tycC [Symbiodinium natans]|uniref:TycC protein n=1 Tax=Symbiodinium natans TaxID=878477 RepID=A0A812SSY2_9DINO|nr:tycC [Symbiodinium natans]
MAQASRYRPMDHLDLRLPQSVPEAYEHQAIETPQAAAICVPGQLELSYEVVVERSRLLASRLSERLPEASKACSVGLLVDRTHPDFLPLLLACARCLRPFILLSTDLPDAARQDARNRFLVETLKPSLVVADSAERVAAIPLVEGQDWISLEDSLFNIDLLGSLGQSAVDRVKQQPKHDDAECLLSFMCTGGSQRLKIARVTHRMMLHEFRFYAEVCGLKVQSEQIDVVGLVPDQLRLLAEDPKTQLPSLRLVITWAERLPPALADRWRGHPAKLIELLIATEYWLSFYGLPLQHPKGEERTGTPLLPAASAVKFAILDDSLTPVQVGQVGELYLHGPMVCAGYVDAGDTEAQFLTLRGRRYFKTMDLVRLLPSGGFVYHSRADRHAKLRGQWVDLAALEQSLQDTDPSGDLVAFLALSDACASAGRARELLPWRAALRLRSGLPRTANGKLDGQALQEVIAAEKRAQEVSWLFMV